MQLICAFVFAYMQKAGFLMMRLIISRQHAILALIRLHTDVQADLCFFVFGDIKSFLMMSVLFEESVNVVRLADEINQNVFLEKDKNLLN